MKLTGNITPHFTWEEMYAKSATAKALGITNEPTAEHAEHLKNLATNILEPLRIAWGSPISVSSAYRSWQLNTAVKGSKTSAHPHGDAADIKPANGKMKEFKRFVKVWLKENRIAFDQCIDERNTAGHEWVHIGIMNYKGQQRKQYLITKDAKHYSIDNWK